MTDKEKLIEYELQIEDILNAVTERLAEFSDEKKMSEFEQGRHLAYMEIMDIVKTRHSMILDVLDTK